METLIGFVAVIISLTPLALHWALTKDSNAVSAAWINDNERRSWGIGIDQSRSTWPWKTK